MPFQHLGSINSKISSLLSPALKKKLEKLIPLAKVQLGSSTNEKAVLGSIKLMVNSQFHGFHPAQIDFLTSHTLFEVMRSENQGIVNQINALQQAGASQQAIKNAVQGSQMNSLIKAFQMQAEINKTLHELQMNIIQNLKT